MIKKCGIFYTSAARDTSVKNTMSALNLPRFVRKRIKEAIWPNCDLYHQAGGQSLHIRASLKVVEILCELSKDSKFDCLTSLHHSLKFDLQKSQ